MIDLVFSASLLDWSYCAKLVAKGVVNGPEIYEAAEDGSAWEMSIDLRDPDLVESQRRGLYVLEAKDSYELRKWPSLDAARQALRQAGYKGGVTVHFWKC